MNEDGTGITRFLPNLPISREEDVAAFALSPDGSLLALSFVGDPNLYWVDLAADTPLWSRSRPSDYLPYSTEIEWSSSPIQNISVSPDRSRIAYELTQVGEYGVWLQDISKSTTEMLSIMRDPTWAPDGLSLLAIAGGGDIIQFDLASRSYDFLKSFAHHSSPMLSSDGKLLLFSARGTFDKGNSIYIKTLSSSEVTSVVTDSLGSATEPCWSPNETSIVFQREGDMGDKGKRDRPVTRPAPFVDAEIASDNVN